MMRVLLCIGWLLCLSGCASLASLTPRGPATLDHDPESMLVVTVHNPVAPGRVGAGSTSRGYALSGGYMVGPVARAAMASLAEEHALELVDSWPIKALGVHCAVFTWRASVPRGEMLRRLAADRRVESVQPLQTFRNSAREQAAAPPADPHRSMQHGADFLQLEAAHRWSWGKGVRIAVVDTQVDSAHPDLAGRVTQRLNLVGDESVAAEKHGTAVSGVIAALDGNEVGIVGVAPEAEILALRACWEDGGAGSVCNSFTLARALSVALDAQVDIVNLSLAGPEDPLLARLLRQLMGQGSFIVGAHSTAYPNGFPAGIAGVAVAQVAEAGLPPAGHAILAPGQRIITTLPEGRYAFQDGSSLAAAHVSGVAALVLSRQPNLESEVLLEALRSAAAVAPVQAGQAATPPRCLNACLALSELGIAPVGCDATLAASLL